MAPASSHSSTSKNLGKYFHLQQAKHNTRLGGEALPPFVVRKLVSTRTDWEATHRDKEGIEKTKAD